VVKAKKKKLTGQYNSTLSPLCFLALSIGIISVVFMVGTKWCGMGGGHKQKCNVGF
jgi:hypothetical protein